MLVYHSSSTFIHSVYIKAYKTYIKSVTAPSSNRKVLPGYSISLHDPAPQQPHRRLWINLATSTAVAAPPASDPLNIPLCVSELRDVTGDQKHQKQQHMCDRGDRVVDAVVNPELMDKCRIDSAFKSELVELAITSVAETFGINLLGRMNRDG